MSASHLSRAATLMVILVIAVIGGWELYLRHQGVKISYDNGKELWSDKRARVYASPEKTTVFIGSSRIKYDLDIETFQKATGRKVIQLAVEGSSPMPVLEDLGEDTAFRGRLVVDVTEILFFSMAPPNLERPQEDLAWYKGRTPAQRASFVLDRALESQLVFLDRDFMTLNDAIAHWNIPDRPGVFVFPAFPMDFDRTDFDRQSKMTDRFVADTSLQHRVQNIWIFVMEMGKHAPPPKGDPVALILGNAKKAVDKIRARGGEVFFTRTPSSGPMLGGEMHVFPRDKGWEPLLATTGSKGFHFMDNPATAHLICPEWSHLTPADAVLYTKALIGQLPPSFVTTN